jgi:hypothetical protein
VRKFKMLLVSFVLIYPVAVSAHHVRASVAPRSFSSILLAEDAFSCRTSLSPNLTGKLVNGASWSRLRRVSLPQFELSLADARLAPSAS